MYRSWSALAGYFDGDGTVEFSIHRFTIEIRLAFEENWKPHLDAVREFLRVRGIVAGKVRKKESYNTWHIVVSRIESVKKMARELARHSTKNRAELLAVIGYLDSKITGEQFVQKMNKFVLLGERTGKNRGEAPPYTRDLGRELATRCHNHAKASTSVRGPVNAPVNRRGCNFFR